ncbi:MAG TPA: TonB family protein [Gemmatimonadales bacterium]
MALLLPSLLLATLSATSAAQGGAGTGTIAGVVRDSAGLALAGAVVGLEGMERETRTDGAGRFRVAGVPAGAAVIRVRRLGFEPQRHQAAVTSGGTTDVEVRLTQVASRLDAMVVREQRQVYDARLAGFYARQEKKTGRYITREQIDRSNGRSLPDLLRTIPGVQVRRVDGLTKTVRLRGARCAPLVVVDGFPASAHEFDLEMIDPVSLEGVEVYSSMATVPPEFGAARGLERCGVIAVWSRPAPSRHRAAPKAEPTTDVEALIASGQVFTASEVQRPAVLDSASSPLPAYPDSLWRAGVGGTALVEFVVGAGGEVEPASVRVVTATHPAFGEAARRALLDSVFQPAVLRGRGVRQVVHFPIEFVPGPTVPPPGA